MFKKDKKYFISYHHAAGYANAMFIMNEDTIDLVEFTKQLEQASGQNEIVILFFTEISNEG